MLRSLQQLYKDQLLITDEPMNFEQYNWFRHNDQYIGILKESIAPRELQLLHTFMEPVSEKPFHLSELEKWWYSFLYNRNEMDVELMEQELLFSENDMFRFIQFRFSKPFQLKKNWKEAMSAFFEPSIEIIWTSHQSGVIIERDTFTEEDVDFINIIETTASDFYENLRLFVGSFHPFSEKMTQFFQLEETCFQIALTYNKKQSIYSLEETMPYLLIDQLDDNILQLMRDSFLHSFPMEEDDLLQNVKVFIENNLNVSLTAKKLYLHRNSVQYRIDKFIEKTGLDIKNFQGAFLAYLAILLIEADRNGNG